MDGHIEANPHCSQGPPNSLSILDVLWFGGINIGSSHNLVRVRLSCGISSSNTTTKTIESALKALKNQQMLNVPKLNSIYEIPTYAAFGNLEKMERVLH